MSKDKGSKNVKKAPAEKTTKVDSSYKSESKKANFEPAPAKSDTAKTKKA